jgi:hypothetical protein
MPQRPPQAASRLTGADILAALGLRSAAPLGLAVAPPVGLRLTSGAAYLAPR